MIEYDTNNDSDASSNTDVTTTEIDTATIPAIQYKPKDSTQDVILPEIDYKTPFPDAEKQKFEQLGYPTPDEFVSWFTEFKNVFTYDEVLMCIRMGIPKRVRTKDVYVRKMSICYYAAWQLSVKLYQRRHFTKLATAKNVDTATASSIKIGDRSVSNYGGSQLQQIQTDPQGYHAMYAQLQSDYSSKTFIASIGPGHYYR